MSPFKGLITVARGLDVRLEQLFITAASTRLRPGETFTFLPCVQGGHHAEIVSKYRQYLGKQMMEGNVEFVPIRSRRPSKHQSEGQLCCKTVQRPVLIDYSKSPFDKLCSPKIPNFS